MSSIGPFLDWSQQNPDFEGKTYLLSHKTAKLLKEIPRIFKEITRLTENLNNLGPQLAAADLHSSRYRKVAKQADVIYHKIETLTQQLIEYENMVPMPLAEHLDPRSATKLYEKIGDAFNETHNNWSPDITLSTDSKEQIRIRIKPANHPEAKLSDTGVPKPPLGNPSRPAPPGRRQTNHDDLYKL